MSRSTFGNSVILPFGNSVIGKTQPGFSLVELIVVVGIIGVLSGVLIASFSGGTESARAAKCLNNMRNLAQGAFNYSAGNNWGFMPSAGTWVKVNGSGRKASYEEHLGWISWLSMNDEYGSRGTKDRPSSFISIENAGAYTTDDKRAAFAITNGVLFKAVSGNQDIYVCPDHRIACEKKGAKVRWSYVMNAYFGYDWSDGSKAIYADVAGLPHPQKTLSNAAVRPERRLLFAELPIYGTGTRIDEGGTIGSATYPSTGGAETDCVLQYKGYDFGKRWSGTPEAIAFNHKSAKRFCAHVVFADGHTEKLLKPKTRTMSDEQLTALLCSGKDIGFDGSAYEWVNSTDKSE